MTKSMFLFFDELQRQFGAQIHSINSDPRDENYILLNDPDIRPGTNYLRGEVCARLVMVFAEDRRSQERVFFNYYVFEQKGSDRYLLVRAPVGPDAPRFPSLSAELPAVNWQEREIQDWFGLKATGHPNPRRVALHDNWPDVYPLRKDFPLQTVLPPFEGERHIYRPALGEGVFQVPVGPVHAGTIEPGHFNFAVAGEPILYLQLRMFYTHKGTEKLFEKLPISRAVFLAESISGDSAFSHGTAFCQAIERAAQIEVPLRALIMRTILLELERSEPATELPSELRVRWPDRKLLHGKNSNPRKCSPRETQPYVWATSQKAFRCLYACKTSAAANRAWPHLPPRN